jgi:hypothetical protein
MFALTPFVKRFKKLNFKVVVVVVVVNVVLVVLVVVVEVVVVVVLVIEFVFNVNPVISKAVAAIKVTATFTNPSDFTDIF